MNSFDAQAYHILVVDDDHLILRMVGDALENAGFQVVKHLSGEAALKHIRRQGLPHLAVVDINMPFGMDGFEFCEVIHQFSDLPIIMLTAVDADETIINALDYHVEDYITKPFSPGELVARVRRVLRRIGDFSYTLEPITKVDDYLSVDLGNQCVYIADDGVSLTPTENKLLHILMRNAGHTVTSEFIVRRLWPYDAIPADRLRVYIHRLRHKIEQFPRKPRYIISHRGVGYIFVI